MCVILHVVSALRDGGVEKVLMNYEKYMSSQIRFDFITHRPGRISEEYFQACGSRIFHLSVRREHPLRSAKEAYYVLRKEGYQIVHLHGGVEVIPQLFMAWLARVPVRIVHSHGYLIHPSLPERIVGVFARICFWIFATDFFACSDNAGLWTYGKAGCRSGRYHKLYNAIPWKEYAYQAESRERIRRELDLEGKLVIGHIGRFTNQKNQKFLLPVLKKVLERRPETVLLFIGDGELRSELSLMAERAGLSSSVRFLGSRRDVPALLQAMDVFVLPSIYEGLPVSGIEAQAAGLPCVFSDGITKETSISDQVCYLNLSDSPNVWANKILEYATIPRHPYAGVFPSEYNTQSQAWKLEKFYLKAGHFTK